MPDFAADSVPTFQMITSMRRLPSLVGTVRTQAASPAMPTLSAAESGSSEPRRCSSEIVFCGEGL